MSPVFQRFACAILMYGGPLALAQVSGDTRSEDFEILASDGTAGDEFGRAMDADDRLLAIGADFDDQSGSRAGSVYLYDLETATEIGKILPDQVGGDDRFGVAVGVHGGTLVVGAPNDDDRGQDAGAVYLFDITDPHDPVLLSKHYVVAPGPGDRFGATIALGARYFVVGSPGDDLVRTGAGSAMLHDALTGERIIALLAEDGDRFDTFGASVSVDDSRALVGAPLADVGAGSAYIFAAPSGDQLFEMDPNEQVSRFGVSVLLHKDVAYVGALGSEGLGGAVFIFDGVTGEFIKKFEPQEPALGNAFGRTLAAAGCRLVVGAGSSPVGGDFSGSAYVFDISDPRDPVELELLVASQSATRDEFSESLAINYRTVIGGAPGRDNLNGDDAGAALVYQLDNTCDADLDGNCVSDAEDLRQFLELFAAQSLELCDLDGDGDCDSDDFFLFLDRLASCGGTPFSPNGSPVGV